MPDQRGCKLCLIRHGKTANSGRKCFNGHFDVKLSDKSSNQIFQIAKILTKEQICTVYSSDLKRASESANIIAKKT